MYTHYGKGMIRRSTTSEKEMNGGTRKKKRRTCGFGGKIDR